MTSAQEQALIEFTRELVRIPSVLGHEQAMAAHVREEMVPDAGVEPTTY